MCIVDPLQTLPKFSKILVKSFKDPFFCILSVIPFIHTNTHSQMKSFITFHLAYCNAIFSTISKDYCCCRIAVAETICLLSAFVIFYFLLLLSLFLLDIVHVIATCKHSSSFPYFAFFNFLLIIGFTASIRACPFVPF